MNAVQSKEEITLSFGSKYIVARNVCVLFFVRQFYMFSLNFAIISPRKRESWMPCFLCAQSVC